MRALLAKKLERYDDMAEAMKQIIHSRVHPTTLELHLLDEAYQKMVRRSIQSLDALLVIEVSEPVTSYTGAYAKLVRQNLENYEFSIFIREIVGLINYLIIHEKLNERHQLMLYRMKGDFLCYQANQVSDSQVQAKYFGEAQLAYETGLAISKSYPGDSEKEKLENQYQDLLKMFAPSYQNQGYRGYEDQGYDYQDQGYNYQDEEQEYYPYDGENEDDYYHQF